MEVMRDLADNVVIICSIENLDPMGIHRRLNYCRQPKKLAPRPTQLRDAAMIIREIGWKLVAPISSLQLIQ